MKYCMFTVDLQKLLCPFFNLLDSMFARIILRVYTFKVISDDTVSHKSWLLLL